MALALTDEQAQLSAAVAGFATRHAPLAQTRTQFDELAAGDVPYWWKAFTGQGFHAVHLPESAGGQGGGLTEAACVLDAAGYALLPGPLLPTMIAGAVAAAPGAGPVLRTLAAEIAEGTRAVVVLPESGQLTATPVDGGWELTGAVGPVVGLAGAQRFVVSARTDTHTVWTVLHTGGDGLDVVAEAGTDLTRDVATLRVDGHLVSSAAVADGFDVDAARFAAVALTAAEAAGVARWCTDNVIAHLKVREQFGQPIGAFQALQHRAAALYIDSELIAASAWDAARAADQPAAQQLIAAAGAAIVGNAKLPDLALDALTMFGAIGYTWEHDMHLYWRRAISLSAASGPVGRWARQLGEPAAPTRDFSIELPDVETEFRARVVEILDHAATVVNDQPGRQSPDYANLYTGAQRDVLAAAGLLAPHLPAPWGLDATPVQQLIITEEFDRRPEVVRSSLGIAEWILPTILAFGSDAQRAQFAEPILRGTHAWCQLFSEPGAGSDLAALSTRATRVDGGWRIDGQKVWTSSAHCADWGALLARTDPEARKHKGIGYFLVDMTTPGITVRPLRTATGDAHFNEVFFDDVFVPDDMLVGAPDAGWSLALATMANERAAISGYINNDRESVLRNLADGPGADREALVRALGEVRAATNAIAALNLRDTLSRLAGHSPGPATSIAKVATGAVLRRIGTAAVEFAGPAALTHGVGDTAVAHTLQLPAEIIGGGTREIQLNIIATMILGLPRR
ncbi:acyl-CoA dehydrogenase [Mycolicibacterium confluentis]|uniref:Acyl-CoA dehydrogenase n=1 Tax=Mycolicibacterium confluentis TaxID=28047 RepID=A0A7I7XYY6_9MYCO|nr:acyl-CoA dehydrogenase [Mycolicibacterium confluentis]MCV7317770.1 acyl-CoA dehydrogenase [Mycolicibacterium confluentis]ORV28168.1 acyl-CoA dehydrogenase [Mycolicibacterium confluentis]BBZ34183.1 acyl-CoA dehydrogenase [Mycolicibacterium confluentis]